MRGRGQRSAADEAEFRRAIDEAKQLHKVSDVLGRKTALKRAGRELRGLCIVHEEKTPSLYVNDTLGVFICRGCGWSGDIIDAVMKVEGLAFREVIPWLGVADLPRADPAQRVQAAARDDAARASFIKAAQAVWASASPAAGTLAEAYLRSRGIVSWPDTIRFARTWAWMDSDTGETGPDLPALIGAVTDASGVTGVQRIFLAPDGTGKAHMRRAKLSLGRVRGGALKLGPAAPTVMICEGPEDGLSLRQELPNASVWVALGTSNMAAIDYPDVVTSVVICSQNDPAGERATVQAAAALLERGYLVSVRHPDRRFKDWNDQLRCTAAETAA